MWYCPINKKYTKEAYTMTDKTKRIVLIAVCCLLCIGKNGRMSAVRKHADLCPCFSGYGFIFIQYILSYHFVPSLLPKPARQNCQLLG